MNYWQHLKKANFHRDFIRDSTILKILGTYHLESALLGKTISFPKIINFLVTLRCNLRCAICHTADALTSTSKGELSTKEVLDFVERCASFSPDWHFSGGEPFARLDLPELLSAITHLGMRPSVVSNGLLITPRLLKKLEPGTISSLTLSVLGVREDHDREVGKKGAYNLLRENLLRFKEAMPDSAVYINCPLTPGFTKRLRELEEDFCDLPLRAVKFSHLNYLTPGEYKAYETYSKREEFSHGQAYSYQNDDEMSFMVGAVNTEAFKDFSLPHQMIPQLTNQEVQGWYQNDFQSKRPCHFIWHSTYLYPNGEIKSCHFLQESFGNIREKDILEIWNCEGYQKFRNSIKKQMAPACSRCCKL